MSRKSDRGKDDEAVSLYYHKLGREMGRVELVVPSADDPTDKRMICRSEAGIDFGVIYSVDIDKDEYAKLLKKERLETLAGAIIESTEEKIQILESSEETPIEPPDEIGRGSVRSLRNPTMWTHPWGRCCCVKHGGDVIPVTTEAIRNGDVPWWGSVYTPYQLDMIQAAADSDECGMHVLAAPDRLCGVCGHYVWCVMDEDVPEELPEPPEEPEVDEPLVPERSVLDDLGWRNKKEAWELFREDPTNAKIIESSGLAIGKASDQRQFGNEQAFARVNSLDDRRGRPNLYTVKAVFYAALGTGRSGSWADLDLDFVRMVVGLENVDLPAVVIEEADLGDDEDDVRERVNHREARAESDSDASILDDLMDDEYDEGEDENEDDFIEPGSPQDDEELRHSRSKSTSTEDLIATAQNLQQALATFIKVLKSHGG